ncbi:MAG: TetR family transcriptional regulator [Propionibacteriales bacterium]|nr:TetR family transcriptional regulator [Propionibacteriales bacterium]
MGRPDTRTAWLDLGLETLRGQGIDAVRIDQLAARLHKTRGSFHHHFNGAAGFRQALLDRFEEMSLSEVHRMSESSTGLPVAAALEQIARTFRYDATLEAAVRGWAETSAQARATMTRLDAARLTALIEIWRTELPDLDQARMAALVPHLVIVGASITKPTPSRDEVAATLALLAALVPHVGQAIAAAADRDTPR